MSMMKLTSAATLALACAGAAFADEDTRATYFSVMGSYTVADDQRDVDNLDNGGITTEIEDAYGMQFALGQMRQSGFGFELSLFNDIYETEQGNGTDFYRYGVGLDVIYAINVNKEADDPRDSWMPYLIIGGGAVYNDVYDLLNTDPDNRDDYGFYANAGIGMVTPSLNKYGMKVRLDLRYVYDDFESGYDEEYKGNIGIEFPLFGEPKVIEKVVETVKVVEVSKDSGLKDSDNDGIVDNKDNCPNTPEGVRVDGEGCPLGGVVALDGVTFEFNGDRLRPDAATILEDAAEVLNRYPEMLVEVAGHTDSIGGDAYNQTLSQKRAEAVRQFLIGKGISAERLTAVGYGESEPRATNDTEEGRELNRRVELRIQN